MKKSMPFIGVLTLVLLLSLTVLAQRKQKDENKTSATKELDLKAFKFRNIGPALMSGRIADIAIHPENQNIWY
ncbi:hypothetical protein RZS08_48265, partial [Arthrospira platensis SPKY1]|nr:hypothetical protein [Arthrospira platensis SPKY1]